MFSCKCQNKSEPKGYHVPLFSPSTRSPSHSYKIPVVHPSISPVGIILQRRIRRRTGPSVEPVEVKKDGMAWSRCGAPTIPSGAIFSSWRFLSAYN